MDNLSMQVENKKNEVIFNFLYKNKNRQIYFRSQKLNKKNICEASLCIMLPIAMRLKKNILISNPLSKKLFLSSEKIQDIFLSWDPKMVKVKINAQLSKETKRGTKKATFFSCGIDSFDTLLRNIESIDVLVYVEGYDVWPHETDYLQLMRQKISDVARIYNKEIIFIESNLHYVTDDIIEWGKFYHGAALAAAAHFLPRSIGKVLIPSTFSYDALFRWGSHPVLDELWSGAGLEIIHEGAHLTRPKKIVNIYCSKDVTPNEYVRVCTASRSLGIYNCSKCEKCIRTMIVIKALKRNGIIKTFDSKLELKELLDSFNSVDSDFMLFRLAEVISYFRQNKSLTTSAKLKLIEDKFKELVKFGFPSNFLSGVSPFIPIDLSVRPSINISILKKYNILFLGPDNLIKKLNNKRELVKNKCTEIYGSQNILRIKHLKRLFK